MELNYGLMVSLVEFMNAIYPDLDDLGDLYDRLDDTAASKEHRSLVIEPYKGFGFEVIGFGGFRIVLTHPEMPGVVFKVAYNIGADALLTSEYQFYHDKATAIDRENIARCIYYSGNVVVMERVQGASPKWGGPQALAAIKTFNRAVGYRKVHEYVDVYSTNLIIRESDGRPILIDYAVNWD